MSNEHVRQGWKDIVSGMFYVAGAVSAFRALGIALGARDRAYLHRCHPIFVIHRIGEDDDFFPALSLEAFRSLVSVLSRHYNLLSFEEIATRLRNETCGPMDTCVTFDDAYAETHRLAEPILREHGALATTFVVTAGVQGEHLWFDELAHILRATTQTCLPAPKQDADLPLVTRADRINALRAYKIWLRTSSHRERRVCIDDLYNRLRVTKNDVPESARLLDHRDLTRLARARDTWHIGSHTVHHVSLDAELPLSRWTELVESRLVLEQIVDREVTTLAYPHGAYNEHTLQMLTETGYLAAASADVGGNVLGTNPLVLQRTTAYWPTEARAALGIEREFYRLPSLHGPFGLKGCPS